MVRGNPSPAASGPRILLAGFGNFAHLVPRVPCIGAAGCPTESDRDTTHNHPPAHPSSHLPMHPHVYTHTRTHTRRRRGHTREEREGGDGGGMCQPTPGESEPPEHPGRFRCWDDSSYEEVITSYSPNGTEKRTPLHRVSPSINKNQSRPVPPLYRWTSTSWPATQS